MFQGVPWRLWVKRRRKALGLTQAALAVQVTYSVEMIGHVERGLDRPSPELTDHLARVLEVPPEEHAEFVRVARLPTPTLADGALPLRRHLRLRIPGLPATPLIDRADELTLVRQLLGLPAQRLVTITGPAGVGKTRLAMAVAQELEATYPDGVFWVALVSLRDPLLVLNEVAQTLGIKETGGQPLLDVLQTTLWDQQILLVLDNCEQVEGLSSVIAGLLAAPGLQILCTSRKRLRVRGEQQVVLAPLPVPPVPPITAPLEIEDLRTYPALALFLARAQETSPDFALDAGNAAAVAQICAALDGLPLALELAAVRIRVLPPAAMLARLHERLAWLVGGPEDLPAHQQTLAGALAWSYDLLSSDQQLLFRRLSAFAGGFTLAAAEAICANLGGLDTDTLSAITDLNEWSLVYRISEPATEPRYAMLEIIHEHAASCLEESGEAAQLRCAHLEFYLSLAEKARAMASTVGAGAWLDRLADEQANFRAALDWGISSQGDPEAAGKLAATLGWFWETRGYWQEGRHWFKRLLGKVDHISDRLAAQLRYYAGRFAYLQGDYASAGQLLEESLALSRAQEDISTEIQALNSLGWIAYSQCDYPRARHFYAQSLTLCRAMGEPLATATVLNVLGGITSGLGDQITAEQLLQESLSLRREQGDRQGIARSLNGLGLVAQQRDEPARARQLFLDSLDLFRDLGDRLGVAMALNNLGWLCLAEGQPEQGQVCLAEALDLAREMGSAWCIMQALCYLGWVALEQGTPAEAAQLIQESLTMAQAQGMKQGMILCHLGLSQAALITKYPVNAATHLRAAEQLRQETGFSSGPFERRIATELQQAVQSHLSPLTTQATHFSQGA